MIIVSAYYNIPSKRPKSDYSQYIKLFFKYIRQPQVIFFTDEENYLELKPLAGENVTFQILNFEQLDIFNDFSVDFWKQQIELDPEKYHTWQLGALWANKSRFVKKASEVYPNNEWYMWVDAGCIRDENWEHVVKNFGNRKSDLKKGVYVQLLNNLPNNKFLFSFIRNVYYIAGSHILFHKDFLDTYIQCYSKTIHEYVENKTPIIMDQYIIATMALKNSFITPILYDDSIGAIDKWFFFFNIF